MWFVLTLAALFISIINGQQIVAPLINNTQLNTDVLVETVSSQSPFDGPKVNAMNSSSYDWWYFDAVSSDGKSGIQVVFLRGGFDIFELPQINNVIFTVVFPNGTSYNEVFPANISEVSTEGFGSSGNWPGSGFSFTGSPDLSTYCVQIDNDQVKGSFYIKSIAPAHYPNGSPPQTTSAVSTTISPFIEWCNAIPGGISTVDITILGTPFQLKNAIGYHDKNWGGISVFDPNILNSWYWGHATVGPYTLVFYDLISGVTGTRFSSAYLAENGVLLFATQNTPFSASSAFSLVLPYGNNTQFPPPNEFNATLPLGFSVTFVDTNGDEYSFLTKSENVALDENLVIGRYNRWVGTATGGKVGGTAGTGVSTTEWLRFF
jgi:hypothetical protein